MQLTSQQEAIVYAILKETHSITIKALAGTGKTTTLVIAADNIIHQLNIDPADIAFVAFNREIVKALDSELKRIDPRLGARTVHSLMLAVLTKIVGRMKVEQNKYFDIADQMLRYERSVRDLKRTQVRRWANKIARLGEKVRITLCDERDLAAIAQVAAAYDVFDEDTPDEMRTLCISKVPDLLYRGQQMIEEDRLIDFADMLWGPVVLNLLSEFPKFKWLLVDECQDLSALQHKLIYALLSADGRAVLVGDPNQAIYMFAGASNNSFFELGEMFQAREYPLPTCWRCPISHLELARQIVPDIEAAPNARAGEVLYKTDGEIMNMVRTGDMVICRKTAPLISLCLRMISNRLPARVKGRDIGGQIADLALRIAEHPQFSGVSNNVPFNGFRDKEAYQHFGLALTWYVEEQIARLAKYEGNESKIEALSDKRDALRECFEKFVDVPDEQSELSPVEQLADSIRNLFAENAEILLCTVHRAKGLQAQNVYILEPGSLPLVWKGQTPEQMRQEMNLKYVALTRAKDKLIFIEPRLSEKPKQTSTVPDEKPESIFRATRPIRGFRQLGGMIVRDSDEEDRR